MKKQTQWVLGVTLALSLALSSMPAMAAQESVVQGSTEQESIVQENAAQESTEQEAQSLALRTAEGAVVDEEHPLTLASGRSAELLAGTKGEDLSALLWSAEQEGLVRTERTEGGLRLTALAAGSTRVTVSLGEESVSFALTILPTGWVRRDKKTLYYDGSGTLLHGLQLIDGRWYLLDEKSGERRDGFATVDGKRYYFAGEQGMLRRWIYDGSSWYYGDLNTGEILTGRQSIGGSTYLFDETTGAMKTGMVTEGERTCFLSDEGALQATMEKRDGKILITDSAGKAVSGWRLLGGSWYYCTDGVAAASGLRWVGKFLYCFSADGKRQSGWKQVNGSWYYFAPSDGVGAVNGLRWVGKFLYCFSADGKRESGWKQVNGSWYYFAPSDGVGAVNGLRWVGKFLYCFSADGKRQSGWKQVGDSWYYFAPSDGVGAVNGLHWVGQFLYCFSADGKRQSGWKEFSGKKYYFDQNNGVAFSGWHTIDGNTYYFNPQTHVMATGMVKVSATTYSFRTDGSLISRTRMIDVSHYQGSINWTKVKNAGITGVIIQAGHGSKVDSTFHSYIRGAKAAGLRVGVYWFSYAYSSAQAREEAQRCLKACAGYSFDLPVFFDWEYDSMATANRHGVYPGRQTITNYAKAFCEVVRKGGRTAGVYYNLDYQNNHLYTGQLKSYRQWLAKYSSNIPGGYDFVQYSGSGRVNGISGDVDLDYCFY